ncbi:hypothetical protein HK105_205827 [Polyrhizophydium stewartii]|uniref:Uncharacterized protein n=1 Tax=Polyrhizophydium stewartii TaxID=2732419 RepID=A0ABR4N588_9FUNG
MHSAASLSIGAPPIRVSAGPLAAAPSPPSAFRAGVLDPLRRLLLDPPASALLAHARSCSHLPSAPLSKPPARSARRKPALPHLKDHDLEARMTTKLWDVPATPQALQAPLSSLLPPSLASSSSGSSRSRSRTLTRPLGPMPTIEISGVSPADRAREEQRAVHAMHFVTTPLPIVLQDPSATASLAVVRYSEITQSIRGRVHLQIPLGSPLLTTAAAAMASLSSRDSVYESACHSGATSHSDSSARLPLALDKASEHLSVSCSSPSRSSPRRSSVFGSSNPTIADLRLRVRYRFDGTDSCFELTLPLNDCIGSDDQTSAIVDFAIPFESAFITDLYSAMRASQVDTTAACFELDGCVFFVFDILCPSLDGPCPGLAAGKSDDDILRMHIQKQSPLATIEFEVDFSYSKNPNVFDSVLLSPRRAS